MMIDQLTIAICLTGLMIGSYTDIKKREVPDWLNFSLIASGIGIRIIASIFSNSPGPIISGLTGFSLGCLIGYLMYKGGQWGGGDAKMLMGIGALVGIEKNPDSMMVSFLINLLFVGAVYGLAWSAHLAINNRKKVMAGFKELMFQKHRTMAAANLFIALALIMAAIFGRSHDLAVIGLFLSAFMVILMLLWFFVKIVEKDCMIKKARPDQITEGDWVFKSIYHKGKYICGPKDLGLTKRQIRLIKKLAKQKIIKEVYIKEGIPFVPSFLIAFVMTMLVGNLIILVLR
jgi:Flp pilus assembly protein protease CpaA